MLAQEILAVVVAVGGTHHRVDVVARGPLIAKRDAALVVELDENDRAMDAIIEHTVAINAAHPGEKGIRQVLLYLRHSDFGMARPDVANVDPD
jgi:hypothetical protein